MLSIYAYSKRAMAKQGKTCKIISPEQLVKYSSTQLL